MGIKDNFSQAVKELWKKDGQDEQPNSSALGAQPSELDKYLQQPTDDTAAQAQTQEQAAQPQNPAQGGQQAAPADGNAAPQPNVAVNNANAAQTAQNAAAQEIPLETPYYRTNTRQGGAQNSFTQNANAGFTQNSGASFGGQNQGGYNANSGFGGGGYVPPAAGDGEEMMSSDATDEVTVISKNTIIDGNVRSLANMQIDGNIKGNVETTRNIDMTGKIVGDITCNNAGMSAAAMQGNVSLKGKMRMDRDTILIGDLTSQYADINGRIRGKLEVAGKAELKRDAIVFGDINASTIAVTDGAIIQGYVNTTFLSQEDGRNAIPEAISFDKENR